MLEAIRVLCIVPYIHDTSPGQRFRIEQWEQGLSDLGVELTYAPFETPDLRDVLYTTGNSLSKASAILKGLVRRWSELNDLKKFDAVYLFREAALIGPAFFERQIAFSGVPIVFDFDDAIFFSYKSPSNGYLSYLKFPNKTGAIIRRSAHVMAGNRFLADYALKFNPNVTIIPTTIDTEKYAHDSVEDVSNVPVIGWSGSFSTVQHLDTIRDVLQRLAAKHKFKLRVIGTPNYAIEGVETESIKWSSETEIQDLQGIDIGIMPLPDDDWSKGKCGLKALQYMALEKPTVCSPVGVNTEIVQDGVNGFIAGTSDEWIEKLSKLILDTGLRRSLGAAGRKTVVEKYSAIAQVPRVYEIFKNLIERR